MKSISRLFVVVALCLVGLLSTHTDVAVARNAGASSVCGMPPEVSGLLSGVKIYPYECEYGKIQMELTITIVLRRIRFR